MTTPNTPLPRFPDWRAAPPLHDEAAVRGALQDLYHAAFTSQDEHRADAMFNALSAPQILADALSELFAYRARADRAAAPSSVIAAQAGIQSRVVPAAGEAVSHPSLDPGAAAERRAAIRDTEHDYEVPPLTDAAADLLDACTECDALERRVADISAAADTFRQIAYENADALALIRRIAAARIAASRRQALGDEDCGLWAFIQEVCRRPQDAAEINRTTGAGAVSRRMDSLRVPRAEFTAVVPPAGEQLAGGCSPPAQPVVRRGREAAVSAPSAPDAASHTEFPF